MRHAIIAIVDTLGRFQSRPADILRFNAIARIEAARHSEIASARDDSHWRSLFAEVTQLGISTGEIRTSSLGTCWPTLADRPASHL